MGAGKGPHLHCIRFNTDPTEVADNAYPLVADPNGADWPVNAHSNVLYCLGTIQDGDERNQLYLEAQFTGQPNQKYEVRAIAPDQQAMAEYPQFDYEDVAHLPGLFEVDPATVSMNEEGFCEEGYVRFQLKAADLFYEKGIHRFTVYLQWQYKKVGQINWEQMPKGITGHYVYTILDRPGWPWVTAGQEGCPDTLRPLWMNVLEEAQKITQGCKTRADAASKITTYLVNSGMFVYNTCGSGRPVYSSTDGYFFCTDFIDRLKGFFGRGPSVNCSDCALMVVVLANAVGCDLQVGRIAAKNQLQDPGEFALNPVYLIGKALVPQQGLAFKFHDVAWEGPIVPGSIVYDACVQLIDPDTLVGIPPPIIPTGMTFGDCAPTGELYKRYLALPGKEGCAKCIPQAAILTGERGPIKMSEDIIYQLGRPIL